MSCGLRKGQGSEREAERRQLHPNEKFTRCGARTCRRTVPGAQQMFNADKITSTEEA